MTVSRKWGLCRKWLLQAKGGAEGTKYSRNNKISDCIACSCYNDLTPGLVSLDKLSLYNSITNTTDIIISHTYCSTR